MKTEWRKSDRKIGNRKAIEHTTKMCLGMHELCLSGKHGEIWIINENTFGAVVTGNRLANKLAPSFNKTPEYKKGDEMIIKFGKDRLQEMIKTLVIPRSQATQIQYAERFGKC